MRGAGGHVGRLPAADKAGPVGLLDMDNHAVTETRQRGSSRALLPLLSPSLHMVVASDTSTASSMSCFGAETRILDSSIALTYTDIA